MSYYVRAKHEHSRLFSGFGYTVLQWCSGSYQAADIRHDRLNARSSIAAVQRAFHHNRVVDERLFNSTKQHLIASTHATLQSPISWMSVLRGMSLSLPSALADRATDFGENTLRDLTEGDVLGKLRTISKSDYDLWVHDHGPHGDTASIAGIFESFNPADTAEPFYSPRSRRCRIPAS